MNMGAATNSFLTQIVMDLKSGNLRRCQAMGLTIEEIQALNQITVDDLHYLTHSHVSIVSLQINHETLSLLLEQSKKERERMQRIDNALSLGASIAMLDHYFGLTTAEVSARRRLLGIEARQGRVLSPSEEQESQVWHQWKSANVSTIDSLEALEIMMLIAEQSNLSLTAVWSSLKIWESESLPSEIKPD